MLQNGQSQQDHYPALENRQLKVKMLQLTADTISFETQMQQYKSTHRNALSKPHLRCYLKDCN